MLLIRNQNVPKMFRCREMQDAINLKEEFVLNALSGFILVEMENAN